MKTKLDNARDRINEIDLEMIKLFKERMNAVSDVVAYKLENKLPVLDSSREHDLIEKNLKALDCKELEEYYLTFFDGVLKSSKDYQKKIKGE
ncbi:MAG: chorismate mutase [Acholeplasmatales bacterium]|nr:chorismate mutase [Acholeplasmatales bacterium]